MSKKKWVFATLITIFLLFSVWCYQIISEEYYFNLIKNNTNKLLYIKNNSIPFTGTSFLHGRKLIIKNGKVIKEKNGIIIEKSQKIENIIRKNIFMLFRYIQLKRVVEIDKLKLVNGIYYFNDKIFTGRAGSYNDWDTTIRTKIYFKILMNIKAGKLNGEYIEYSDYSNNTSDEISEGFLSIKGDYKDGHKIGKWIYYDAFGHIESENNY